MQKFSLIICLAISFFANGQVNNFSLEQRMPVQEGDSARLFLGINLLGFGKNNEYFNTILDGYTLFGYQLNPYLSYNIAKNVRVDAGLYAHKNFGDSAYAEVSPTLSLKIIRDPLAIIFGTLEGGLHHRLIEPLYDFENVINRRLENGIQLQIDKDHQFLDVWVDWRNMISFQENDQEEFTAGLSFYKTIFKKRKLTIEVPVQVVMHHKGGQIDISTEPMSTIYNGAYGFRLKMNEKSLIDHWGVSSYIVQYQNLASKPKYYNDGLAYYINPFITTSFGLTCMGSFWAGHEFQSFQGSKLFSSVNEWYPDRIDENRKLIMLRFLYDINVAEGVVLTIRAEPFYDTFAEVIQYSYGFYFNVRDKFFLLNAKKNR